MGTVSWWLLADPWRLAQRELRLCPSGAPIVTTGSALPTHPACLFAWVPHRRCRPPCRACPRGPAPSSGRCCWACLRPTAARMSGTRSWCACAGVRRGAAPQPQPRVPSTSPPPSPLHTRPAQPQHRGTLLWRWGGGGMPMMARVSQPPAAASLADVSFCHCTALYCRPVPPGCTSSWCCAAGSWTPSCRPSAAAAVAAAQASLVGRRQRRQQQQRWQT